MSPQYTPKAARQSRKDRFWSKVDRSGDCWIWTAGTGKGGYGRVRMHGVRYRAHRIAFLFAVGPIPEGMRVLHHGDNPPCCNPDHLFLGTDADNVHDCMTKGRHAYGERAPTAKLSEADVIDLRSFAATGMSFARLAPLYGVSIRTVRHAVEGDTWRHV